MGNFVDLSGQVFGRLTAIDPVAQQISNKAWLWRVVCACGNELVVLRGSLRSGHTNSCGCLARESLHTRHLTHGQADHRNGEQKTKEYRAWANLIQRCENPKTKGYLYYGGRGITVYPEWRDSFEAFYAYIGSAPTPRHSIDRINVDSNYEPGNVRWATWSEQRTNQRRSITTHDQQV